jgi:thiol:disulfide interchange protein DsbC
MTMKTETPSQSGWAQPVRQALISLSLLTAATTAAWAQSTVQTTRGTAPSLTSATPAANPAHAELDRLAKRLQALYPSTRFGDIHPTAWPGVFEVAMGANLAYVDASGQYFLFGHLYDMKTQRDLTAERKDTLARVDFHALPLADALKEVRGQGSRVLAIFSDPDCPYCRRLETELKDLSDVTIYTFLLPLASLHPEARAKAIGVWCSAAPVQSWRELMLQDQAPPTADCTHPVDRNVALAEQLGIHGTPTLIAGDGRMTSGAASRQQIDAWLSRGPASPQSAGTRP